MPSSWWMGVTAASWSVFAAISPAQLSPWSGSGAGPTAALSWASKTPGKTPARALLLEPHDLLLRLVAAVPPPRSHLLRYFGVLSSHAALRPEVVPAPPADPDQSRPPPAAGDQLLLLTGPTSDDDNRAPPRRRWAWLLRHVFAEDVDTCSQCGGPMRWLEAATTPDAIARLLADHGLAPRAPPHRSPPPPGQLRLPFAG